MTKIVLNVDRIDLLVTPYYETIKFQLDNSINEVGKIKILSGISGDVSAMTEELSSVKTDVNTLKNWLGDIKSDYNTKISDLKTQAAKISDDGVTARTRLIN